MTWWQHLIVWYSIFILLLVVYGIGRAQRRKREQRWKAAVKRMQEEMIRKHERFVWQEIQRQSNSPFFGGTYVQRNDQN